MILLVTDVFVLLTQVLLWVVVALFAWYVLLRLLPRPFLGGLVLLLLLGVTAFTFYQGSPQEGLFGDIFRIIAIPFSPLGIILILLLIAFGELLRGGKLSSRGSVLLRIAIPVLLILSIPVVSNFLAQRAEAEALSIARPLPQPLAPGAQRVIVALAQDTTRLQVRPLSAPTTTAPASTQALFAPARIPAAGLEVLEDQPIQLTENGDILTYTRQLYQEERDRGNNPLIIVSAGSRSERRRRQGETVDQVSEAADARRFLQTIGVPGDAIQVDSRSPTIQSSAVNVRQLLRNRNFGNQIVLVASAIEMSRAALTFNREFNANNIPLSVIASPTNFFTLPPAAAVRGQGQGRAVVERNLQLSDLLPSIDALSLSSKVINEYLTSIYYFLRGWIRPVRTTV